MLNSPSDFDSNIEFISKIKLTLMSFFGGQQIYTYLINGDEVKWESDGADSVSLFSQEETVLQKTALVEALREFHLGEWEPEYFNPHVLDGMQWELRIEYSNGKEPLDYCGINAFPFNFDEFAEFMKDTIYIE